MMAIFGLLLAPALAGAADETVTVGLGADDRPRSGRVRGGVGGILGPSPLHGAQSARRQSGLRPAVAGLAPGRQPVLRIGGNSADHTWWPIRGVIPPGGASYSLTNGWLRTTQALAAELNARLITGINLATGRPAIAAAEARAILKGIGRRYIQALELGNEPDLYGVFPWYRDRRGRLVPPAPRGYACARLHRSSALAAGVLPQCRWPGPAFAAWAG